MVLFCMCSVDHRLLETEIDQQRAKREGIVSELFAIQSQMKQA